MASKKSFSDIRASILRPAMTSQFMAYINFPQTVKTYLSNRGLSNHQGKVLTGGLNLACTEASLPGSSLATLELTSDHTGVTERHVHRRMFDERIDLTFYVDAAEYLPIRAFEYWKEYIVSGSSIAPESKSANDLAAGDYYHRMKYPDSYITGGGDNGGSLRIVNFERDFDGSFRGNGPRTVNGTGTGITYNFVRVFPISVASMPISYEASSLLKCTVSLSYVRYFLEGDTGDSDSTTTQSPQASTTPPQKQQEANRNDDFGNTAGPGTKYGERDTATGALMNGGSDGPLITTRQELGLDPI